MRCAGDRPARVRVGSEQGGEAGQDHAAADDEGCGQQLAGGVEEAQGLAVSGIRTNRGNGLPGLNRAGLGLGRAGCGIGDPAPFTDLPVLLDRMVCM